MVEMPQVSNIILNEKMKKQNPDFLHPTFKEFRGSVLFYDMDAIYRHFRGLATMICLLFLPYNR
jgi:hypothetical protein